LATGEYAGKDAQVTVTVRSIKERELPEPDDEFAQLASEFDTIDELRASLRDQVRQVKSAQQAEQIRNATMDALLAQVDVPVPEGIVQAKFDEVLAGQGSSREQFEAETRSATEKDVKTQLLLDALADDLQVQVGQDDLTERLLATSRQYGIEPQQLFGYMQENNQLPSLFADVRRGLAIAAVVEAATVTDTDGNTIDTSEFFGKRGQAGLETEDATEDAAGPEEEAEDSGDTHDADEADESSADVAREASDEAAR
jgi:trigger factor